MTLDLISAGIAVVLGLLGWRAGALTQLFRVGAVVGAFVGAAPFATLLEGTFRPGTAISGPVEESLLLLGSGLVLYLAFALVAAVSIRMMRSASDRLSFADRFGGLVLGVAKAAVVVYFLASAVSMVREPLRAVEAGDWLGLEESRVVGFVDRHDLLVVWRFRDLERLHDAIELAYRVERGSADPVVGNRSRAAGLLRSPEFRRLMDREELVEAAREDRYYATLADPSVRKVLNDERFVSRLRLVDWRRLLEELRGPNGSAARRTIRRRRSRIPVPAGALPASTSASTRSEREPSRRAGR